jgi:hypothetical protein
MMKKEPLEEYLLAPSHSALNENLRSGTLAATCNHEDTGRKANEGTRGGGGHL